MAIYAIGDVQGCYDALCCLLEKISFDQAQDTLWFAGDLVNRGPQSLETLRFIKSLGEAATIVLGNHDLHMLAIAHSAKKIRAKDTFQDVLDAADAHELLMWLRMRKLIHRDGELGFTMVHAGLVPQWTVERALAYADEVHAVLHSERCRDFFENMYGNEPSLWNDSLSGWQRLRFITNALTRIRFCSPHGAMTLDEKGEIGSQSKGYMPWFEVPGRASFGQPILFGHWAALGAGYHQGEAWSLDSGCVWGGRLSALRLDGERKFFSVVA